MREALDRLSSEPLRRFAGELLDAGFTVYVPKRAWRGDTTFLKFSREVSGKVCYGLVTADHLGAWRFTMPIKPTQQYGNAMLVDGVGSRLDLANAEKVARPVASGVWVSPHVQDNWEDLGWLERIYERVAPGD
jgi:hypothetical protein